MQNWWYPWKTDDEKKGTVSTLNFLGITLEYKFDKEIRTLYMHQKKYILSKLHKRDLLVGKGSWKLPTVKEGKEPPMDKNSSEYVQSLKQAQEEIGTLMWLSIKTRADLLAIVSIAASIQSRDPTEALRIAKGCWRYLAMTWNEVVKIDPAGSWE